MTLSDLVSMTPLEGGWSGETFLAETAGEKVVVRLFADPRRGPHAAEVQEAVLRLVRGLVPVPAVLEVRRPDAAMGVPALLVTEYVDGVRGDDLLTDLAECGDDALLRRVGAELGRIAGVLAGMPFLAAGPFADGTLAVEPWGLDLSAWVEEHAARLLIGEDDLDGLRAVADRAQGLLDTVGRASLVHSDLNPKNVLIDPDELTVVAVLDWEFAHAGHPFTDLGNLLRFDRHPTYVEGVLGGFLAQRGGDADTALEVARAADLAALVELAARQDAHPVAARAHRHLLAIARTGDLHATAE